mmetsp:Transcript_1366/g.1790  ORF Transcript_1366/g.1790 Transcript_1366/m.1790 type:complete len:195 (-) Transcript_1366:613-1197(-)
MQFQDGADKLKCFRVIDEEGNVIDKSAKWDEKIPTDLLKKMFTAMVTMNEADKVFNAAQRQSRISFYMTQTGEEASNIGSAAALEQQDLLFPQYRESGAIYWRGMSLQQMAHQMTGNQHDIGRGKQMPVHYGSEELNVCTISSPLATQIPQASGSGYKFRINKEDRLAVTYFGDGAASEGDFHPALNFAATLRS